MPGEVGSPMLITEMVGESEGTEVKYSPRGCPLDLARDRAW